MTTDLSRLERLIEDERGERREGDVERRLAALDALEASVPDPRPDALAAMAALGDDTRHRLARLLVAAEDPLCVCELEPLVDVGDSAVSHALADLVDAGLATRRKEGSWRYYDATEGAERLLAALDATREGSR